MEGIVIPRDNSDILGDTVLLQSSIHTSDEQPYINPTENQVILSILFWICYGISKCVIIPEYFDIIMVVAVEHECGYKLAPVIGILLCFHSVCCKIL